MEEQVEREELLQDAVAAVDVCSVLLQVCRRDSRYRFGAYQWLLAEGLDFTMRKHLGLTDKTRRHITGREIAFGLRALAIEQFGPLARDVWRHWGINRTRDWGHVVYNLIDAGLLHKNDDDRIDDFDGIYDVDSAFA
jgi:uncharacterized repeat protein (TIGR04138 family)